MLRSAASRPSSKTPPINSGQYGSGALHTGILRSNTPKTSFSRSSSSGRTWGARRSAAKQGPGGQPGCRIVKITLAYLCYQVKLNFNLNPFLGHGILESLGFGICGEVGMPSTKMSRRQLQAKHHGGRWSPRPPGSTLSRRRSGSAIRAITTGSS